MNILSEALTTPRKGQTTPRLKNTALGIRAVPDPLLYISIMSWHVTETIRLLRFYDDVKHLDFVMSRKLLFDDVSRTVRGGFKVGGPEARQKRDPSDDVIILS